MRKLSATTGFSLVEVTLALGIAAFCLLAVFALIPVAALTSRNATSQTSATNIMAAVVADLRATPKTSTTSTQFGIRFGTNATLYFDGAGSCSCDSAGLRRFNPANGSCSLTWSPALQLRYQLNVTWNSMDPAAGCSTGSSGMPCADLKVTWPAAATPTNASGSTEMLVVFDRN
jgi:Tfp pilus assembly protein PilV